MRRLLALLCLLVAAVAGYNLVVQEFQLTGIPVNNFKCNDIANLHVGGLSLLYDCYDTPVSPATDPPTVETRHIMYKDKPLVTKAKNIDVQITLGDSSVISFQITPQMKAGAKQTEGKTANYKPVAATTSTAPPTTTVTVPVAVVCTADSSADDKAQPGCMDYCDASTPRDPACPKVEDPNGGKAAVNKAVRKTVFKPKVDVLKAPESPEAPVDPAVSVFGVALDSGVPAAVRVRGPGPARPPAHYRLVEDTVVSDDDEEARLRVKRDGVESNVLNYVAVYYILDEAGNPAAVWAAVIEGIILILLVGACFYFFFWAPRARQVAAAAADPYKDDGPSYSVSYANSSYNNQRIDAFQPPASATPAAPARPSNSAYMDDYITDNIGAMSRPGATTTQPASAAANSSAFQPGHQRFDSSGLVTVNLS